MSDRKRWFFPGTTCSVITISLAVLSWLWCDHSLTYKKHSISLKAGLHQNANTNAACENDAYVHVCKFVDCSAFAEAANRPYINVLYANSLWCTDSRRIAFGCLPNVRHTAECCLPRLRNTSTSNVQIVFACCIRVRVLFAFRCKRGFRVEFVQVSSLLPSESVSQEGFIFWHHSCDP